MMFTRAPALEDADRTTDRQMIGVVKCGYMCSHSGVFRPNLRPKFTVERVGKRVFGGAGEGGGGGLTEPTHGRELRAQLIPPLMGRGVVSGVVCRGRPPVFRQPAGQMIDPGANLHGDQPGIGSRTLPGYYWHLYMQTGKEKNKRRRKSRNNPALAGKECLSVRPGQSSRASSTEFRQRPLDVGQAE